MKMMNHFNKKKKRIIRYSLRVSSKYINLECVDVKVISISITITHREGLFDGNHSTNIIHEDHFLATIIIRKG